ncbi:MAG: hypothetical protein BGN91_00900 [Nitrobacter sp. 62-13]|nr:MAG: hypothetical protein BGN91_00900 [Nitrobacter sp. 62-13]
MPEQKNLLRRAININTPKFVSHGAGNAILLRGLTIRARENHELRIWRKYWIRISTGESQSTFLIANLDIHIPPSDVSKRGVGRRLIRQNDAKPLASFREFSDFFRFFEIFCNFRQALVVFSKATADTSQIFRTRLNPARWRRRTREGGRGHEQ